MRAEEERGGGCSTRANGALPLPLAGEVPSVLASGALSPVPVLRGGSHG